MPSFASELILIGGGGHCKSVIDVIESTSRFKILAIADPKFDANHEYKIFGYPIVPSDESLGRYQQQNVLALVTVGQLSTHQKRESIWSHLLSLGFDFPAVVSNSALVSRHASVAKGAVVMHGAVVNAEATIGKNCIINTNSLVEHGSNVGDHCHISTGAIVNGDCSIGSGVFIGSNAVILHGKKISSGVVVGAGAVVVRDLIEPGVYVGNPARRLSGHKGI